MKKNKLISFLASLFVILIVFSSCNLLSANDAKKKSKSYLYLDYYKYNDSISQLKMVYKARIDKKVRVVENIQVELYFLTDTEDILVDEFITDFEGKAIYEFIIDSLIPNSEGDFKFKLVYNGNNEFKKAKKNITFRDLDLKIGIKEKDSFKTVKISAVDIFAPEIEIKKLKTEISVKRLFGLLPIELKTLKKNKAKIEFPNDIPGDPNGNLEIFVKIIDNKKYGNIIYTYQEKWGVPVQLNQKTEKDFKGLPYMFFMIFTACLMIGLALILKKIIVSNL